MENNFTLEITDIAKQDISSTLSYIANDLYNKKAADELYLKINKALNAIHNFPSAQAKSNLVIAQTGYDLRKYPIDNYILYYGIKDTAIIILRFIFGRRDVDEKYF